MNTVSRPANPVDDALDEAISALRNGNNPLAAAAARRATELNPDRLEGWWLSGLAANEMWAFDEAEQALAEGIRRAPMGKPLQGGFMVQRARALSSLGRATESLDMAIAALNIGLSDAANLNMIGNVFAQAGKMADARNVLVRAVAADQTVPDYWFNLGSAQQFLGNSEAAEKSYESAISAGPHTAAHLSLARLRRWTQSHNHIERLLSVARRTPIDATRIGYALFKEYDDLDQRDQAWEWLQKAAWSARNQPVPAENGAWSGGRSNNQPATQLGMWNSNDELTVVEAWQKHFPVERFSSLPPVAGRTPRRIFIVGLPRSGTTLVERILAAHSQVQALGELQTFPLVVKRLSQSHTGPLLDADTISAAVKKDPRIFADAYDSETAYHSDGSAFTIDKLPHNHDYVGLIRLAFPDALIVHVQRSPMDALFGAYKLLFAYAYRWSYNQDDLAEHYANYRILMDHWRQCLAAGQAANPLIDIKLEALIADPEAQIRWLLDACGLPFEAACLTPHETTGPVATASSVQVRKPINAEGIGAWRRYEAGLAPLRGRLQSMGILDNTGDERLLE